MLAWLTKGYMVPCPGSCNCAGEADRIVPASKMSAVTSLLRNSQSAVVPECGHLLHEEAPAELVQLLRAFSGRLRQLLGPSTGV